MHKELTTNPFPRSFRAEDDRRGGSMVEQSFEQLQWRPLVVETISAGEEWG